MEEFLQVSRVERRLSPHTLAAYRRDIQRLHKFARDEDLKIWAGVRSHHARGFASRLHRDGLSAKSIQRTLSSLRGFYRFLMSRGQAQINPFTDVRAPKAEKRLPKTLDVDQMASLVEIDPKEPLSYRDRAIMELMYSSGLRLSELCNLDLAQLMLEQGLVRVTGKGGKTREVPVGRAAILAVRDWLKRRQQFELKDPEAVFVSKFGRRIHPRTVQHRIRHWARKQGIATPVNPHMLRHSFASHILESSSDLRAVQELLGHANISTTQIYTHLDFQHLAKVYDKSHPRARNRRDEEPKN